ncbi:MAG TPA: ribonuclease HIII [Ignavibacteriaceae bacterium]|nr:ribonuclease HIII [Ignavibacteriaceae bacterium]
MDHKEETALKILDRYVQYLTREQLRVSERVKNEYSYQVAINDDKEKISLHVFFGKKGNKIVLQGNKDLKLYKKVNELIFGETLIPDSKPELEPSYPYVGTDESGKGDYFGPLVVAGVYITPGAGKFLKALGIKDSKELSDYQIKQFANEIRKVNEIIFDVVLISPEKYNQLYEKMGNLNRLMGWAHARVVENLLGKCDADEVISDKFGNEKIILDALQQRGREINLKQLTKAEKFTAVAAASILARDAVVKWFNNQSRKYKLEIPKGSSTEVEKMAKQLFEKYGEEMMRKMVKIHFKTSQKVFNS